MAVQHRSIVDAERHEPKGASTAPDNSVLKSNGDGTTTFEAVAYSEVTGTPSAAAQADSAATDVAGIVADFNSLLAKMRTAGLLNV